MHFMNQNYAEVHMNTGTIASQWCNQKVVRRLNVKVKNTPELVATAESLMSARVCSNIQKVMCSYHLI